MSTDDGRELLRRVQIDEAIHRLLGAGITNQLELTRILAALTGLSMKEVTFNVELICRPLQERRREPMKEFYNVCDYPA